MAKLQKFKAGDRVRDRFKLLHPRESENVLFGKVTSVSDATVVIKMEAGWPKERRGDPAQVSHQFEILEPDEDDDDA